MTEHDLSELAATAEHLAEAREAVKFWTTHLHIDIQRAVAEGVPSAEVARVAGVSKGRVTQLAPVPKGVQTPIHAQKSDVEPVRVSAADTVPVLPDTSLPALSGYVSNRRRQPYGKATAFYDVRTGALVTDIGDTITDVYGVVGSTGHVLDSIAAAGAMYGHKIAGRVYLTGPLPESESTAATIAERVRDWALADPGPGWRVADRGHYLHDPSLPILRFTDDANRTVTIMRAASWWGETDADLPTCVAAWAGLERELEKVPAFRGAGLADTPATTGRALWLRTIPDGKGFPVLSDELRELIHATSGQGRIELRPDPIREQRDFTYLDGRFMYAALTWGMPVGEPQRWTAGMIAAAGDKLPLRERGRWRITATVPEDWSRMGMLMAPGASGSWVYPSRSGQRFTTWADGSEVHLALSWGWSVQIHEGITWAEGKPLNSWTDALVSVWAKANESEAPAAQLAARAVRSILLYALGAFASRTHNMTGSCAADAPELVPADAIGNTVRRVGDRLVWETPGRLSAWSAETAHPEWSATVWARARTRLLDGKGVGTERVGALHLPTDRVVAFATDALYVAGGDPGWADDGKPGRFRVKGTKLGLFSWPTDRNALYQLRNEAEQ